MPSYTHPILRRDTSFRALARGVAFWLRYWRTFHSEENLDRNPLRFAWRQAWGPDVRNRENDRVKYG